MKVLIELRPGEGGTDAKLLTEAQRAIYLRYAENKASGSNWETWNIFDLVVEGDDRLVRPLMNEAGGHRWQRVPPTERRGRVHTSTVTVAVFLVLTERSWTLRENELSVFTTRGSGAGGQHRNKTDSCVVMRHLPTGIEVRVDGRCQHQNRRRARELIEARVAAHLNQAASLSKDAARKAMVGSGMRGDKIRTYREQDDAVTDHRSGKRARLSDVRNGQLNKLFE